MPKTRFMANPAWQEIVSRLMDDLRSGAIPAGSRLPSAGEMAARMGVSRMTVLRAYHELARLGWVQIRYGDGTFASHGGERADPPGVAQLDAWAATLGLKVNPWAMALTTGGGEVPGALVVRRRVSRRERAWLGYRMRTLVGDARRMGLADDDLEALFRAALAWESRVRSCPHRGCGQYDVQAVVEAIAALQRRRRTRLRRRRAAGRLPPLCLSAKM